MSYRWELLVWLWLAYFLNQADRQVFGVVLPLVQADLGLTDVQAGLVASVFIAAFGLVVPLAGYAGDVLSRKRILTLSLLGWSLATLLTGFGGGLLYLIVVRSLATAVGEAAYAPSAFALISEHHVETRAQALAIHQTALYAGVIASGWVAGYLGQLFGWRAAFWVFGAAGLILAGLVAWRLRPSSLPAAADRLSPWLVARTLMRRPTIALLGLGFAGMVFVSNGYATWTPTHLHQRFGMSLAGAGFASMFYYRLGSAVGVLLGGRISDRLAPRRPGIRLELQAAALILGAPWLYWLGRGTSLSTVFAAVVGFGFFSGLYDSNLMASPYEVIEPRLHASGAAVMIAFAFLMGSAAPVALGAARQAIGLAGGLSALGAVFAAAGICILLAVRFFFAVDRRRVRLPELVRQAQPFG